MISMPFHTAHMTLTWKKKAAYIFHTVYKNSCILVAQTLLVQALKCVFADNPDFWCTCECVIDLQASFTAQYFAHFQLF